MARSTAPSDATREPLRLIEASLRDGGLMSARMIESWRRAVIDAQAATTPFELGTVQWRLATEQAACWAQAGSVEFDRWFGASAALLTQTPRVANEVAHRLGVPAPLDAADDVVYAPLAAVENLRSAWSHTMRQWAETLRTGQLPS